MVTAFNSITGSPLASSSLLLNSGACENCNLGTSLTQVKGCLPSQYLDARTKTCITTQWSRCSLSPSLRSNTRYRLRSDEDLSGGMNKEGVYLVTGNLEQPGDVVLLVQVQTGLHSSIGLYSSNLWYTTEPWRQPDERVRPQDATFFQDVANLPPGSRRNTLWGAKKAKDFNKNHLIHFIFFYPKIHVDHTTCSFIPCTTTDMSKECVRAE